MGAEAGGEVQLEPGWVLRLWERFIWNQGEKVKSSQRGEKKTCRHKELQMLDS